LFHVFFTAGSHVVASWLPGSVSEYLLFAGGHWRADRARPPDPALAVNQPRLPRHPAAPPGVGALAITLMMMRRGALPPR